MTATFSLAPEPFWYIVNLDGEAAGGAYMYTKSSLNFEQDKIVYQDAGGTIPWTNPIIFDLNGVQGPFYWEFDSDFPDDLYFLEVWSANKDDPNSGAVLLWTINDFSPGDGSGGGSNITTYLPLSNYIANNHFINHIYGQSLTSVTNLVIAPSNHKGFTPALINPVVTAYGTVGPDIRFVKDTTVNTETLSFPEFLMGESPISVTPIDYVRYQCSTNNAGELLKAFQFPITQKVKNLSEQTMSFIIWAATTSGTTTLTSSVIQYFGSGTAASSPVRFEI